MRAVAYVHVVQQQLAVRHAEAAQSVDDDDEQVYRKEGQPVEACEHPVCLDRRIRIARKRPVHAELLVFFLVECPHDAHARYVFKEHGAHPVRQLLQFAEERGGAAHDEEDDDRDDGEHRQKDQPHDPNFQKCEDAVSESVR